MKRALSLLMLVSLVFLQCGARTPLYSDPAETSATYNSCKLSDGGVCYHTFQSTQTTTTADSDPYEVDMCDLICYKFDSDGSANLFVKECSSLDSNEACVTGDTSVFTEDLDLDGGIDAVDEAQVLDGTAGLRGFCRAPAAKWHYIDVQVLPGSGSVHVSIKCHK